MAISASPASTDPASNLRQLSGQVKADIRARGLRDGDRYLTATQVGQLLGVSTSTAHRTLRLLADSNWVVRQRKRGTFVGPGAGGGEGTEIRTVRVLMSASRYDMSTLSADMLMHGIRGAISNVSVQFDFVPADNRAAYLRKLLDTADADGNLLGFIAVSCAQQVYRRLAEAAVPTVMIGSPYLGDPPIPSIDADHHQLGSLLAQHLVDGGHRRIAICNFSEVRPGDNRFYEGVSDVLTAARFAHNALRLLTIPRSTNSFEAAMRHLLGLPDRPTALMTVGSRAAEMATSIAEQLGLAVPDDIEIVFRDTTAPDARLPHAHVRPTWEFERIVKSAATMLDRLSRGLPLDEQNVVVPVELHAGHGDGRQTSSLSIRQDPAHGNFD